MNALDILINEHNNHRRLLEEVSRDPQLYPKLRADVIHHVNMEEAIFYPRLLKVKALSATVLEAWEEHNLIMQLIQELDGDLSVEAFGAKLETLKKLLLLHIEDEESKLFSKLRSLATPEFLLEVGRQMLIQKRSTDTEEILYPEEPGSHQL